MNIVRESKANQNDILKIELTKEDYAAGFESKLKKYSKTMDVKGFRKGAVPVGMIKKMYGESILAEEINALADKALGDFIKENDIKLLGRPILADGMEMLDIMPGEDRTYQIDFEIGYEPSYEINPAAGKYKQYEINVTTAMVDKEIENVMNHFSKLEDSADPIAGGDTFYFNFDNGQDIKGESFCSSDELTESGKLNFIGKKTGDKIDGIALEIFDNTKLDVNRYILNQSEAKEELAEQLSGKISFEITNVKKKTTPTELTAEQIGQVARDESKTTMEELKMALQDDIKKQYDNLSLNFLRNDVYTFVSENTKMDLPTDFLKKWLVSEKENNFTTEKVEKEYPNIEKSIKWDLITAKYATDNNIKVEVEEIRAEFATRFMSYFGQSGYNPPADQIDQFINNAMKDKDQVRKTFESLLDTKILDKMIESIKTDKVAFTEDQFVEESKLRAEKNKQQHEHTHECDDNCDH
jgi:trigger factor